MHVESEASRWYVATRKGNAYSEQVVEDFELGLARYGIKSLASARPAQFWDVLGRAAGRVKAPMKTAGVRAPALVGLMGLAERQLYPYVYRNDMVPFIWDCWPNREKDWHSFFRRYHFRRIAFTCSDAADYWSGVLKDADVHWIPEAVDHRGYTPGPALRDRPSAVLEIGRRYNDAHRIARSVFHETPRSHTFSETGTQGFLPSRQDLVSALHSHRSLLCYPASISHPSGRTGSWETMTHRYLEAVATKTLVIGHVPTEMKRIFGFEPGISVSLDELPGVLRVVSEEPDNYQDLVERSYARLLQVATWDVRVGDIVRVLLS